MVRDFAKAVLMGTLAGAWLPLMFTVIIGLFWVGPEQGFLSGLYIAALPLIIAFPVVLGAGVVIGFPVTFALRALHKESVETYTWIGAVCGITLPVAFLIVTSGDKTGVLLPLLGMFSGGVTGRTWGKETVLVTPENY